MGVKASSSRWDIEDIFTSVGLSLDELDGRSSIIGHDGILTWSTLTAVEL